MCACACTQYAASCGELRRVADRKINKKSRSICPDFFIPLFRPCLRCLSSSVREALKENRFRWHSVKKCWYGRKTAEEVAQILGESESTPTAEEKPLTLEDLPEAIQTEKYKSIDYSVAPAKQFYQYTNVTKNRAKICEVFYQQLYKDILTSL